MGKDSTAMFFALKHVLGCVCRHPEQFAVGRVINH